MRQVEMDGFPLSFRPLVREEEGDKMWVLDSPSEIPQGFDMMSYRNGWHYYMCIGSNSAVNHYAIRSN